MRPRILGLCTGRCRAERIVPSRLVAGVRGRNAFGRNFVAARLLTTTLLSVRLRGLASASGLGIITFRGRAVSGLKLVPRVTPQCHTACFDRVVNKCTTKCCDCL